MRKNERAAERHQVSFSLDEAQLSRIDEFVESSSTPWHKTSRAEVLRTFVEQGIARVQASTPAPRKKRRAASR